MKETTAKSSWLSLEELKAFPAPEGEVVQLDCGIDTHYLVTELEADARAYALDYSNIFSSSTFAAICRVDGRKITIHTVGLQGSALENVTKPMSVTFAANISKGILCRELPLEGRLTILVPLLNGVVVQLFIAAYGVIQKDNTAYAFAYRLAADSLSNKQLSQDDKKCLKLYQIEELWPKVGDLRNMDITLAAVHSGEGVWTYNFELQPSYDAFGPSKIEVEGDCLEFAPKKEGFLQRGLSLISGVVGSSHRCLRSCHYLDHDLACLIFSTSGQFEASLVNLKYNSTISTRTLDKVEDEYSYQINYIPFDPSVPSNSPEVTFCIVLSKVLSKTSSIYTLYTGSEGHVTLWTFKLQAKSKVYSFDQWKSESYPIKDKSYFNEELAEVLHFPNSAVIKTSVSSSRLLVWTYSLIQFKCEAKAYDLGVPGYNLVPFYLQDDALQAGLLEDKALSESRLSPDLREYLLARLFMADRFSFTRIKKAVTTSFAKSELVSSARGSQTKNELFEALSEYLDSLENEDSTTLLTNLIQDCTFLEFADPIIANDSSLCLRASGAVSFLAQVSTQRALSNAISLVLSQKYCADYPEKYYSLRRPAHTEIAKHHSNTSGLLSQILNYQLHPNLFHLPRPSLTDFYRFNGDLSFLEQLLSTKLALITQETGVIPLAGAFQAMTLSANDMLASINSSHSFTFNSLSQRLLALIPEENVCELLDCYIDNKDSLLDTFEVYLKAFLNPQPPQFDYHLNSNGRSSLAKRSSFELNLAAQTIYRVLEVRTSIVTTILFHFEIVNHFALGVGNPLPQEFTNLLERASRAIIPQLGITFISRTLSNNLPWVYNDRQIVRNRLLQAKHELSLADTFAHQNAQVIEYISTNDTADLVSWLEKVGWTTVDSLSLTVGSKSPKALENCLCQITHQCIEKRALQQLAKFLPRGGPLIEYWLSLANVDTRVADFVKSTFKVLLFVNSTGKTGEDPFFNDGPWFYPRGVYTTGVQENESEYVPMLDEYLILLYHLLDPKNKDGLGVLARSLSLVKFSENNLVNKTYQGTGVGFGVDSYTVEELAGMMEDQRRQVLYPIWERARKDKNAMNDLAEVHSPYWQFIKNLCLDECRSILEFVGLNFGRGSSYNESLARVRELSGWLFKGSKIRKEIETAVKDQVTILNLLIKAWKEGKDKLSSVQKLDTATLSLTILSRIQGVAQLFSTPPQSTIHSIQGLFNLEDVAPTVDNALSLIQAHVEANESLSTQPSLNSHSMLYSPLSYIQLLVLQQDWNEALCLVQTSPATLLYPFYQLLSIVYDKENFKDLREEIKKSALLALKLDDGFKSSIQFVQYAVYVAYSSDYNMSRFSGSVADEVRKALIYECSLDLAEALAEIGAHLEAFRVIRRAMQINNKMQNSNDPSSYTYIYLDPERIQKVVLI